MKCMYFITVFVLFVFCTGCSNIAAPSSGSSQSFSESRSIISSQSVVASSRSVSGSQTSISVPATWPKLSLVNAYPKLTFNQPLEYLTAPGDDDLVFIVGKTGLVYVFDNDPGVSTADIFLDISNLVDSTSSEKGLLGMAFHPGYKSNGYFYVNYTDSNNTVIARYQADPDNLRKGLAGSAKTILTIPQPFSNHNGGHLDFGPDGYLYIGMGDGGSRGDPNGNAQNLKSLLGKILRIDVDKVKTGLNYGIPSDNPFTGNKNGYREEIYAYGFRNPWKFCFDKTSNFLWVADVGQNTVEEIDIVRKGMNYGWNKMEGSLCYPSLEKCDLPGMQKPVWEYRHPSGESITGGYVYSGTRISGLYGTYIYGDYVSGVIWGLRYRNSIVSNHLFLTTGLGISSFGMDKNDEIYILDLEGKIYKFK